MRDVQQSPFWIEVLRGRAGDRYAHAVADDKVVTCLPVMQEVLQGIDDDRAFHVAMAAFADIPVLEDPLTRSVFDEAVRLYRDARRAAITVLDRGSARSRWRQIRARCCGR